MLSFPGTKATTKVKLRCSLADFQTDSSLSSQASLTVIKTSFHLIRSADGEILHFPEHEQGGRKKEKTLPPKVLYFLRVAEQQ